MPVLNTDTYADLIERCERHYAAQGFVKWTDLATELGVSRQLILQMLQRAVCHGLLSSADLDRYRSASSRRAASRTDKSLRATNRALNVTATLTPANKAWLTETIAARPGSTPSDLINTALTQFRTHA
jgi:hypothetical protein